MKTPTPAIDWHEVIAPDEARRHAQHAERFAELQRRKSAVHGQGRALHRKQLAAAQGTLEVLNGLPSWAAHGLFASHGLHEVWVRLSNGGMERASDRTPDIRGFSLKVFGVQGESALGQGQALSQDFTLINQEKFAFPNSGEFVDFVMAASRGQGALLRHLIKRYGWLGAIRRMAGLLKSVGRPFGGFATETFFSALPLASGPYAVRVRMVPAESNGRAHPQAKEDWGADFSRRLGEGALHWDLQLQPFTREEDTPIENASVDWPTPYLTVARLMLPRQDLSGAAGQALAAKVEAAAFDPWQALAAHRPLGEVQRARRVVYFESQKGRKAAD